MNNKQIKAADARSLLDNPVFKDAFNSVRDSLIKKALMCNMGDGESERIVISMQLLEKIRQAIESYIDDGIIQDAIEQTKMKEEKAKSVVKQFNRGF